MWITQNTYYHNKANTKSSPKTPIAGTIEYFTIANQKTGHLPQNS